jgi:hypothetical protein
MTPIPGKVLDLNQSSSESTEMKLLKKLAFKSPSTPKLDLITGVVICPKRLELKRSNRM